MTMHFPLHRAFPLLALLAGPLAVVSQTNNIAINNNGASPAAQAILDISSTTNDKGVLIPRVPSAAGIAAPVDGLTVYQTVAPKGFYHYSALSGKWFRENSRGNTWDIQGSDLVNSTNDFFGTTDNQPVVVRTNNLERMRFMGTTGFLGIGAPPLSPVEQLDVKGGVRIWGNALAGTPGTNAVYSNTSNPGVITYQKDNYVSSAAAPDVARVLLFRGHWGNVGNPAGAAGPIVNGSVSVNPTTGGWRRLENDYVEEFNKPYNQPGAVTCGAPSVEIPQGISAATTSADQYISPYAHATTVRSRHQYMFRASELNPEANQLAGNAATGGLCAGQPINSIAFYVAAGSVQKNWLFASVTVKHAAAGLTDLSGGFDESVDAAQACFAVVSPATQMRPATIGGWDNFPLSTPFVWDGTRNVVIEVVIATSGTSAIPAVKFMANAGFVATASRNSNTFTGQCSNIGAAGSCGANSSIPASGMPWSSACGTSNTSISRPVVQFNGTVASISPIVSGSGAYLRYNGALMAEATLDPIAWGRWRINVPAGTAADSYRGPGTISAEKGIYDNGVRLNDHVFDRAFDGRVAPSDATLFGDQRNLAIGEMADFTRQNHRMPTMRGRESWAKEGGFALGDLTNQLWSTAETQALYVSDLHDRLNVLEMLSDDRPLSPDELAQSKVMVCAMGDLTEQEKAALVEHLTVRTVNTHTQR